MIDSIIHTEPDETPRINHIRAHVTRGMTNQELDEQQLLELGLELGGLKHVHDPFAGNNIENNMPREAIGECLAHHDPIAGGI